MRSVPERASLGRRGRGVGAFDIARLKERLEGAVMTALRVRAAVERGNDLAPSWKRELLVVLELIVLADLDTAGRARRCYEDIHKGTKQLCTREAVELLIDVFEEALANLRNRDQRAGGATSA